MADFAYFDQWNGYVGDGGSGPGQPFPGKKYWQSYLGQSVGAYGFIPANLMLFDQFDDFMRDANAASDGAHHSFPGVSINWDTPYPALSSADKYRDWFYKNSQKVIAYRKAWRSGWRPGQPFPTSVSSVAPTSAAAAAPGTPTVTSPSGASGDQIFVVKIANVQVGTASTVEEAAKVAVDNSKSGDQITITKPATNQQIELVRTPTSIIDARQSQASSSAGGWGAAALFLLPLLFSKG